jgi:hypothetical protein
MNQEDTMSKTREQRHQDVLDGTTGQFEGGDPTHIVGYRYRGAIYCASHILAAVDGARGSSLRTVDRNGAVEATLTFAAHVLGIERDNELSYDEADFPKVIFRFLVLRDRTAVQSWRCTSCGALLVHQLGVEP